MTSARGPAIGTPGHRDGVWPRDGDALRLENGPAPTGADPLSVPFRAGSRPANRRTPARRRPPGRSAPGPVRW